VEIEYFITLCELPLPQLASFDKGLFESLRNIYRNFDENCAQRVKDIEKVTNRIKTKDSHSCKNTSLKGSGR
jgi:adenylosuccinate lyase